MFPAAGPKRVAVGRPGIGGLSNMAAPHRAVAAI